MSGKRTKPALSTGCELVNTFSATDIIGASARSWNTVLMPSSCASCGSRILDGAPIHQEFAAVGLVHAGHDEHQRCLARAVFANQGVNFTWQTTQSQLDPKPMCQGKLW